MPRPPLVLLLLLCHFCQLRVQAQTSLSIHGVYLQWGYNSERYTRSNIRFTKKGDFDFTIHQAKAHDKPDFDAIYKSPTDISIPQYNWRIGFYLNEKRSRAFEINFDHTKYVVTHGQRVSVTGELYGQSLLKDTLINPDFVWFEHTDGANFLLFNHVAQHSLWHPYRQVKITWLGKLGAGLVIPRTDVTMFGKRLNNNFHIAGYILAAESSLRFYPLKNLFLELSGKTGFAHYLNALSCEGGKASHSFGFIEGIGTLGYDIGIRKAKRGRS